MRIVGIFTREKNTCIAQVKMACRDVVKEKGLDRITVEDLVQVKTFLLKTVNIVISGSCPAGQSTCSRRCEERAAEGNQNIFRPTGRGLISSKYQNNTQKTCNKKVNKCLNQYELRVEFYASVDVQPNAHTLCIVGRSNILPKEYVKLNGIMCITHSLKELLHKNEWSKCRLGCSLFCKPGINIQSGARLLRIAQFSHVRAPNWW